MKIVGWNVGNFDFPFVRRFFPRFAVRIHHRVIELNTAVEMVAHATGDSMNFVKAYAKGYAEQRLIAEGFKTQWYNAGYDARAALHAYEYLIGRLSKTWRAA